MYPQVHTGLALRLETFLGHSNIVLARPQAGCGIQAGFVRDERQANIRILLDQGDGRARHRSATGIGYEAGDRPCIYLRNRGGKRHDEQGYSS